MTHRNILLIEDDSLLREVVAMMLAATDFVVTAAADGPEALRLLTAGIPADAVVADVLLPDMSGPEVVQLIWKLRPNLPVLFISGLPAPVMNAARDQLLMIHGFLSKPFRQSELIAALRRLLSV